MTSADPLLLPVGSRLVHIGPHKTGSTAIQSALHDVRDRLAEYDVHYAGSRRRPAGPGGRLAWAGGRPAPSSPRRTCGPSWSGRCGRARRTGSASATRTSAGPSGRRSRRSSRTSGPRCMWSQ
ncbi:MAG: hypothetical protein R2734_03745 [Nocardioides sp.]